MSPGSCFPDRHVSFLPSHLHNALLAASSRASPGEGDNEAQPTRGFHARSVGVRIRACGGSESAPAYARGRGESGDSRRRSTKLSVIGHEVAGESQPSLPQCLRQVPKGGGESGHATARRRWGLYFPNDAGRDGRKPVAVRSVLPWQKGGSFRGQMGPFRRSRGPPRRCHRVAPDPTLAKSSGPSHGPQDGDAHANTCSEAGTVPGSVVAIPDRVTFKSN